MRKALTVVFLLLSASSAMADEWVSGYVKANGTYVSPYIRGNGR